MIIGKLTGRAAKALIWAALPIFFLSAKAEVITEHFDARTMPEGWEIVGSITLGDDRCFKDKGYGLYSSATSTTANYIISPAMEGEVTFYTRIWNNKKAGSVVIYGLKPDNSLGDKIQEFSLTTTNTSFIQKTFTLSSPQRVAIALNYSCFDEVTYTPASLAEGSELMVEDYESGSTFDFGGIPVAEATEATFTLVNTGGADLKIESIVATGGYEIISGADIEIIAKGERAKVTVATPAFDTSGTLTIKSDDPKSPYVIFLNSQYKAPAPVMTVETADIEFGRLTDSDSREIEVGNSGDATLELTVASSSPYFTVTPEQLTVLPGESATFTVTFEFGEEAYGQQDAVLTLTSNAGDPVEIACSAFAKDPSIWEEDFEAGVLPDYWTTTGWTVTRRYSGSNGTYMACSDNGGTSTITTPRLSAAEGETLSFEVGDGTDNTDKLTVEYSHDLLDWKEADGSPLTQGGIHTFTAPEDGYYYLRFCGKYGRIDNFYGFRLALKEHDVTLVASVLPKEGHQYLEYEASVTVREMMDLEEEIVAVLTFDGKEMARAEGTVDAQGVLTLPLTFTPMEPVEIHEAVITVSYADGSFAAGPVAVTVNEAPVWSADNFEGEFEATRYPVVVFDYTPVEGLNTITVPFELNDEYLEAIFGESYETFELKDFTGDEIHFQYPLYYAAGYPYLVKIKTLEPESYSTEPSRIILKDVNVSRTSAEYDQKKGVCFYGTYSPLNVGADDSFYEVTANGTLARMEEGASVKGFKGYITLPSNLSTIPVLKFLDGNGIETGIETIGVESYESDSIYTITGQKVRTATLPGIYIINGKKVLIR